MKRMRKMAVQNTRTTTPVEQKAAMLERHLRKLVTELRSTDPDPSLWRWQNAFRHHERHDVLTYGDTRVLRRVADRLAAMIGEAQ